MCAYVTWVQGFDHPNISEVQGNAYFSHFRVQGNVITTNLVREYCTISYLGTTKSSIVTIWLELFFVTFSET